MAYDRIYWNDGSEGGTPLSAENLNIMDSGIAELDTGKVPMTRTLGSFDLSSNKTAKQVRDGLGISGTYEGAGLPEESITYNTKDTYFRTSTNDLYVFNNSNPQGEKWVKINGGSSINIDTGLNHTTSDDYVLSEKAVLENFSHITFSNVIPVGTTTRGVTGELRYSSLTSRLFYCVSANDDTSTYIWKEILTTDTIKTILKEYLTKSDVPKFVVGKNIFNSEMEFGELRNADGSEKSSSTLIRSGFIKIETDKTYRLSYQLQDLSSLSSRKYFYYDENKNFISYEQGGYSHTTPEGTEYIRIVLGEVTSITDVYNIQIEYGEIATPYEPYKVMVTIDSVEGLQEELNSISELPTKINSVGYQEFDCNIQRQISDVIKTIQFDDSKTANGFYKTNKTFSANNDYRTHYYPIISGFTYDVSTYVFFGSQSNVALAYVDEDNAVINTELAGIVSDSRYVTDYFTTAPKNAVYMAVTCRVNPTSSVAYSVVRELSQVNIANELKLNEKINTHKDIITGSRQRTPLVSFVDDDGYLSAYTLIFDIMKEKKIPFDIAYESSEAPYDLMVDKDYRFHNLMKYNQLQEMIDYRDVDSQYTEKNPFEGAGVLAHTGTPLTQKTGQDLINYVESSYYNLTKRGIYPTGLVYASGYSNEEVRDVVSRYYKYAMRTGSNKALSNYGCVANYFLHRIAMYGYYSSRAGVYDASLIGQKTFQGQDFPYYFTDETVLEWLKSCVDDAVSNNGWLIFMTHSANVYTSEYDDVFCDLDGTPINEEQIIRDLIDYIKSINVDIVKSDYAFEIFGNAVECGDYLGLDNNEITSTHTKPGVAINQLGDLDGIVKQADINSLINRIEQLEQALQQRE